MRANESTNIVLTETAVFLPELKFFRRRKRAFQPFDAAVHIFIGGLGKPGDAGFAADDPLVDQAVQDVLVGLRFSIQKNLVAVELADVAQKDDVGFDSGHDPVNHILRMAAARNWQQSNEHRRKSDPVAHQKLEPKLKNI